MIGALNGVDVGTGVGGNVGTGVFVGALVATMGSAVAVGASVGPSVGRASAPRADGSESTRARTTALPRPSMYPPQASRNRIVMPAYWMRCQSLSESYQKNTRRSVGG